MSDITSDEAVPSTRPVTHRSLLERDPRAKARGAAEARFRAYGIAAILIGLGFLVILLVTIVQKGVPAFTQTYVTLSIELREDSLDPDGNRDTWIWAAALVVPSVTPSSPTSDAISARASS